MWIARRLRGELDADALERSLAEVVRRHDVLRARFEVVDGAPRQILAAPEDFRVDEVPLYAPTGEGGHTFLRVEKRCRSTEEVARALARDVKLLLLDEPYAGLAPVIVQEIEKTLEQIKNLGMTTIIVEQNAVAALHLADRAIILDMGQVVFDGTAQEVLENADLRHEYLAI